MRRPLLGWLLAGLASLVLTGTAAAASHDADTVIVKFRPDAGGEQRDAALGGAEVRATVRGLGAKVVEAGGDPAGLAARLDADPAVAYAEVNPILRAAATPDDPLFGQQWALHNVAQTGGVADADIDAPEGWDAAGLGAFPASGGAKAGLVDTGILATHEDLAGKTADCATADGAGGLVDGSCADDSGHGTHVAGILGARANNGAGVAGVAFSSPLGVCKALSGPDAAGSTADVATCITYLADRGARVISMSLGGASSTTLRSAVAYAAARDAVLLAAVGNTASGRVTYPAGYADVVSVAATDSAGGRAPFSSFNADVEVAAPGVAITSTWIDGGYTTQSGTSMATPHAAGVAAIIRTVHPTWTAAQVRGELVAAVDDLGPAGRDTSFGFGRVNLALAGS